MRAKSFRTSNDTPNEMQGANDVPIDSLSEMGQKSEAVRPQRDAQALNRNLATTSANAAQRQLNNQAQVKLKTPQS